MVWFVYLPWKDTPAGLLGSYSYLLYVTNCFSKHWTIYISYYLFTSISRFFPLGLATEPLLIYSVIRLTKITMFKFQMQWCDLPFISNIFLFFETISPSIYSTTLFKYWFYLISFIVSRLWYLIFSHISNFIWDIFIFLHYYLIDCLYHFFTDLDYK